MSKHTPGPWHVANGVQIRGQRDQIARVWMMRNGEGSANARLIAAAPELLEALKNLEKEFRRVYPIYYYAEPWGHETNVPLQAARAAIARAEGEKT